MKWTTYSSLTALTLALALASAPTSVVVADDDLGVDSFDVMDDSDSEEEGSILELDDSEDSDSEDVDSEDVDSEDVDSEDSDSEDFDSDDSDGDLDDSDSEDDSDLDEEDPIDTD